MLKLEYHVAGQFVSVVVHRISQESLQQSIEDSIDQRVKKHEDDFEISVEFQSSKE